MPEVQVTVLQMPPFKRVYKKLQAQQKVIVDEAIADIVKNPEIGEQKKGDLTGVWVRKFKINKQEHLLAYEWDSKKRILLLLGSHENYYRDLKKR